MRRLLSRITALIKPEARPIFAGYNLKALQSYFVTPLSSIKLPNLSGTTSLEQSGVSAYHISLLTEIKDTSSFQRLVDSSFRKVKESAFNGLTKFEYEEPLSNERLIFFTSNQEFNAVSIQLVTNSVRFLDLLSREKIAVPPPWVAFESYNPSWWGGNMQGAQGFYNERYFLPFFTCLSDAEKQRYYARFNASAEWIEQLELMYSDD
ncbi:hypothetical protein ICA16_25885 [Pseudomonas anatoliensis]|uniref:hypothetical protein n=1 Tax=Pseudomonas anatoliensis TaxID=2710589 RepID=UPI001B336641|nr:hypothetical protein [Pseudomonas anatoliensis]MBP5959112.1 hypothetical protein [Pseudomonas anatoliensis]